MSNTMAVYNHHSTEGCRVCLLVVSGPKWLQIIETNCSGLRIKKIPARDAMYLSETKYRNSPYPIDRAARQFKSMAKRYGATKKVNSILREL